MIVYAEILTRQLSSFDPVEVGEAMVVAFSIFVEVRGYSNETQ